MSKKKTKLANPITGYANQLSSLFYKDKEVTTKFDFNKGLLKICVANAGKALALAKILKSEIKLGNLVLEIKVCLDNGKRIGDVESAVGMTPADLKVLWKTAFKGNKNFRRILQAKDQADVVWTFALFGRTACSWQNDDMQNPELASSALPEQIVKTFADRHPGVQISTDVERLWDKRDIA